MKKLVLIDANALIHRAFHALQPFKSPSGVFTNAVYGFSSTLLKMLKDLEPDYIIAAYDLPGATFRHKAYGEYKVHRAETPSELSNQIPYTQKVLSAFGIPYFEMEGYEADDIIGSLAEKFGKEKDLQTIIVTGDLDTLQLVEDKKVVVYTMRKGITDTVLYDKEAVMQRFGLPPEKMNDYKGLKGDPSDNIPGVKGIGEKTAAELIKKYGSIENLYKKLKSKDFKEPESLKNKLIEGEEQARFSKELSTIIVDLKIEVDLKKTEWQKHFVPKNLERLFRELNFPSLIARIPQTEANQRLKLGEETNEVRQVNINSELAQKIKISSWLLNSDIRRPSPEKIYFAEFGEQPENERDWDKLYGILHKKLEEAGLLKIYEEIELPLIPILTEMERNGIKIDQKALKELDKFAAKEIKKLETKIHKLAGIKFNINSTRQLSEVLFERLKLEGKIRKTPKGKLSTQAGELEKLRELHPIIPSLLDYREFQKLKTTYIEPFPKLIAEDGRIHTSYIQTGTTTGRLASENPNLQNIPIKTELGREFRKVFIAERGFKFLSLDYSQLELRIAAHIAKDRKMITAFKKGVDIHAGTAAEVFDVPLEKVSPEMRREAKALNFGIIYGMGPQGFARSAGITQSEAKKFIERYFDEFPKIREYMDKMRAEAHDNGVVFTLLGRRRQISEIYSSIPEVIRQAERMAINFPVQGTEADIVKMAMIEISKHINKNYDKEKVKMLLQVHDEIVLEVKESLVEKLAKELKKIMEEVYELDAPLVAEAKAGQNWNNMKLI